jgi:maleylacetoacetate isomerase
MSSHALTLYTYWRSSSAYRVRLALAAKGLAYDAIYVNLLEGAQLKDEYRKASPMGHVPCLVIDGEAFVESVAIIELLDEMFPTPPLFPKDARARAHVRALIEMMNAGIQPLQNMAVIKKLSDDNDVRAEWIRHWIMRGFAALESLMQHHAEHGVRGKYAYGDSITAADFFLVAQMYNARRYKLDLAPYPRVVAAADSALAVEALHVAIPERQPDAKP